MVDIIKALWNYTPAAIAVSAAIASLLWWVAEKAEASVSAESRARTIAWLSGVSIIADEPPTTFSHDIDAVFGSKSHLLLSALVFAAVVEFTYAKVPILWAGTPTFFEGSFGPDSWFSLAKDYVYALIWLVSVQSVFRSSKIGLVTKVALSFLIPIYIGLMNMLGTVLNVITHTLFPSFPSVYLADDNLLLELSRSSADIAAIGAIHLSIAVIGVMSFGLMRWSPFRAAAHTLRLFDIKQKPFLAIAATGTVISTTLGILAQAIMFIRR